jgi:hypothetical protein
MAIRGQTKNVALDPKVQKNIDPKETLLPYSIDLRNGKLTDAGNFKKRPGFGEWKDVSVLKSINMLIHEDSGYCSTSDGRVFSLGKNIIELTGVTRSGAYRPIYSVFNNKYIIVDGGTPIKISLLTDGFDTSLLGGTPPAARFIATIGAHVLLAGQLNDKKEIRFSDINNEESYESTTSGSFWVKNDGQIIRNLKVINEVIYIFKDHSIETWIYIQSDASNFIRQQGGWIDTGCSADYSVVEANNTVYWFGDDYRFYELRQGQAAVISAEMDQYVLDTIKTDDMYGFDFVKENSVVWILPSVGKCFVFDYKYRRLYEYNTWDHGQWEGMPINSYMELNGKQYIGDYDPTGKIFEWSHKFKSDNGKPIRVYRKFAIRPSQRGNMARLNRMGFSFDRGVGTASEPKPVMFWRYRTDHGDWMNYQDVLLGRGEDNSPYVEVFPGGVGRDFEFELVATDNVDVLMTNMDVTFQEMSR